MTHKASYRERKTFEIYDKEHAVLYLNEEPATLTDEESGEEVAGYAYTGDMADGGTLVECRDVTAENRRDKFVAGLIGKNYDMNAQIAVLANGADTPEHAAEMENFAQTRKEAKAAVDEMLNR